jgi:hypothetical protein
MLAAFTASALADDPPVLIAPISFERWQSYTGTIVDVTPAYDEESWYLCHVRIETEDSGIIVFVVTADSLAVTEDDMEVGETFTGWYDAFRPVITIYPPQYTAVVYGVNHDDPGIDIAALVEGLFDTDCGDDMGLAGLYDFTDIPILVNGQEIEVPFPPYAAGWDVMVPLRAIAEALGYQVTWFHETRSVRLDILDEDGAPYIGRAVALAIGKDSYEFVYARIAPITLGAAPELTNGTTFVPLQFFRIILGLNNAYFFEGIIEINDGDPMEDDMR